MKNVPWITIAVSVATCCIQVLGCSAFEWRVDLLASGEWWRFLTGHLSHWSWSHLAWDVGVFFILGCILESRSRLRFCATICISIMLTDLLLRISGGFSVYRGLSGIAVGLFQLAMGQLLLSKNRRFVAVGALGSALVLGKMGFELLAGGALFVDAGGTAFTVALEAHLAGLVAAVCVCVWQWRLGCFSRRLARCL